MGLFRHHPATKSAAETLAAAVVSGMTYTGAGTSLVIQNARVLTMADGERPRRGALLGNLAVVPFADVHIVGGRIDKVTPAGSSPAALFPPAQTLDARGRVLMPAFVDCHTHACWAGDRLDEWEQRLRGATYLDILKAGGGIMSTVRAVRAASQQQLEELLSSRLAQFLAGGTTTLEIKSGYGLTTADELKMLRAIRASAERWPGTVVLTALLGHAMDDDDPRQVERTICETLPAISREFPGIAIDAFCETSAWSLEDTVALFEAARAAGHPIRVHADQFNSLGMVREALRLGAVSVDHLEATTPEDLKALGASAAFGVALPVCGLHLDGRFANARALVDAGGALAIATNCNPGSAPTTSMPLAIATAVRHCGLTPAEAIAAATINPASLLGLSDRGTIAPGQRADLILLRHADERMLAYEMGGNAVDAVICAGHMLPPANATPRLRES
jgi:imidazolonepropionase